MIDLSWWTDEELLLHPDDSGVAEELHSRGHDPNFDLESDLHAANKECEGLNDELEDAYLGHQDEINEMKDKARGLYSRIDVFLGGDGVSDTEKRQKEKIKTVAEMMSAK